MKAIKGVHLHQTWGIYGPSGAGKTSLSATAVKPGFLDSNKGVLAVADVPELAHVRSVDIKGFSDLERSYNNFAGIGKKDWTKYGTIVFDHFDEIQTIVLTELGEKAYEKDDRRDIDAVEQREWGIMFNRLRRLLVKFKQLPMHKILIMGQKEDYEEGHMRPSLSGQMATALPYFCDHIAYLEIGKKGRRFLNLNPTEDFYAKTRARWLPPERRRVRYDLENYTFMTDLMTEIAAGPPTRKKKVKQDA